MKDKIVFYHGDCADGFSAAWAAWKKFKGKADYVPIKASQSPDQLRGLVLKNKEIYFLDVCASEEVLKSLLSSNKSVTVIDHHTTNREKVKFATKSVFDLNNSGSVLSFRYFHPEKKMPLLLNYVEDNDLWRFKLPDSTALAIWLRLRRFKFEEWDKAVKDVENKRIRSKFIEEGKLLINYEDGIIRDILGHAYEINFKGYLAKAVNTSVAHSQVGHRLLDKKHKIGIVWYEDGKIRKYSLRSEGATDVSEIAKLFPGGGGHKHAAGFTLPANESFPWDIVQRL